MAAKPFEYKMSLKVLILRAMETKIQPVWVSMTTKPNMGQRRGADLDLVGRKQKTKEMRDKKSTLVWLIQTMLKTSLIKKIRSKMKLNKNSNQ